MTDAGIRLKDPVHPGGFIRREIIPPELSVTEARVCWTLPPASLAPGTRGYLRGLPDGAEGIRTDGHRGRGEISSYSSLTSQRAQAVRGPPSRSRSTPSPR
jgi:hypothetical protein